MHVQGAGGFDDRDGCGYDGAQDKNPFESPERIAYSRAIDKGIRHDMTRTWPNFWNTALACASVVLSCFPAVADQAPAAGGVQPNIPTLGVGVADCAALTKEEGWKTRNKLTSFQVVFGKPAILWTETDFQGLISLAKACHNVQVGATLIDGNNYAAMMNSAFESVMPVAILARRTEQYARVLAPKALKLPPCYEILDYKLDSWASTDNSATIFGADFMAVGDEDLQKTVNYANQCLLYLPDYAQSSRNLRRNVTEDLLGAVMDRCLLILKRRQDWADWAKHPTDIVITIDGVTIPPTMTSHMAREMIMRYDRAASTQRSFTPELVASLMRTVDEVKAQNVSKPDNLYADEVEKRVHQQIFNDRAIGAAPVLQQ